MRYGTITSLLLIPAEYVIVENIEQGWKWLYGRRAPEGSDANQSGR